MQQVRETSPPQSLTTLNVWTLGVGIVATVVSLGLLAFNGWRTVNACQRATRNVEHLEQCRTSIAHIDQMIAMSVRLAAATGEPHWEDQYQLQLTARDNFIQQAVAAADRTFTQPLLQTYGTGAALRAMEAEVFDLAAKGNTREAAKIVFSAAYTSSLRQYHQTVARNAMYLRDSSTKLLHNAQLQLSIVIAISIFTIIALVTLWIVVLKLFSHRLAVRRTMEDALREAYANLERMVDQRTADLQRINARLREQFDRRKEAEAQLTHGTLHDKLTDLPNRALLMERLGRAAQRAKRQMDYTVAVLALDFDEFKVINDSLGHSTGDRFLVAAAARLSHSLRALDTVARNLNQNTMARTGGDEFVLLLDGIHDADDAVLVANRIKQQLAEPFEIGDKEIISTVSIGIAISHGSHIDPEAMLRDADTALHRAKARGKARHVVFEDDMRVRAVERLELESDLRKAVERDELLLEYQPIVRLATGDIEGFEALVRWRHPTRGLVRPDEFIPIAEESDLIIDIGKWVLREACSQLRSWRQRFINGPNLSVAVNVSTKHFRDPTILDHIDEVLEATGLPGRQLKLEITETVLMEETGHTGNILDELKKRQIDLHMDDFGTGYSSLSYLHNLPMDAMKIDRSFVSNMGANGSNHATVAAVITLAHNQGIKVIAEGIETAEQMSQLHALEADLGQGYFFSRPVPAAKAAELLSQRQPWLQKSA
jgi:diguanylate cyclase (GGDEF)-like protein